MIRIRDLAKRFGSIHAVDGISFAVAKGEVLGFLGPNGAGKSTTMKMITGFLQPSAGSAEVCGFDVERQPLEVKRRIGYLPEGAPAYGDMTPLSFLEFCADVRRLSGADRRAKIEAAVEKTTLQGVLYQPVDTLSKGFKRRVGLAQALLHDPEVLILDEPTDGLDPNQKHEVRSLIHGMARDKAIIISTHILEEVDALCSRAVVIASGRIVADGTPGQLEARSRLHNAVTVRLKNPADAAALRAALAGQPGIAGIEENGAEATVLPAGGQPILAIVDGALRDKAIAVEEIKVERGRLDEVFRSVTAKPKSNDTGKRG
ncbi:ABC transporter ATP-binding protein [Oceanibaculum pacificum]|uniref:ABC transporter ATP-binding protein n=1 Tax=Oceanibaculum pacificum TaxID=580166 RepID=A0A154WGJ8_9PROT|nr:ABC transporter ATP-binding protein [Oceanibaculum pacificum]KZD12616.1 ABC transporter ATP-binding protein [Oceanibaculum pacificum]